MTNRSIVEYCAEHEAYHCGYCHSPDTKYTHGLCSDDSTCNILFICNLLMFKMATVSIQMWDRLL